ncbi:adenylate/guanylate cyclase domain-containing protein [Aeromicrobium sp.]|uniref:adenylate/guanylate cyclase domain-containing protein n=1 Tax=Aeromicrobium sp. TaxID=1871063 RepID=UPI003C3FB344
MDPVPTQYIDRDGAALAFQTVGDGEVDMVCAWDMPQHLDLLWTDPDIHHLYERGTRYARTTYLQPRGFGLSDRIAYVPTLEQQAEDILAVMDAVGMRRATLVGALGTSAVVALVAANAPERVVGLVMVNPLMQGSPADAQARGWTHDELTAYVDGYRRVFEHWGSGGVIDMWDTAQATPRNRRLMALLERSSATPSAAMAYFQWAFELDVEDVLPSIHVPTKVIKLPTNPMPEAVVRRVADLIPGATFHLLPPTAPGSSIGTAWLPVADHIEEMATGRPHPVEADRFLGTVLFTDVVGSTELLTRIGDSEYRDVRSAHERQVGLAVESRGGRLLTVTGDGTLSVFDGPSSAVRCAEAICREAEENGISVRAGIHTGELERDGMNVTGLAVHTGARVSSAAGPGQILVSRTVRDLVAGSGLEFESVGDHDLKGIPGTWELFAVTSAPGRPAHRPRDESVQTRMDKLALQTARRAPALVRSAMRLGNAIERRRARTTSMHH